MTAPHDNKWEIDALQNEYKARNGIELNKDQAEKMLRYEQERDSGSSKYFFSPWEELDYEEAKFKEILTSSQVESYLSERENQLKRIEESLIENDKTYLPQLKAAEERIIYYKNSLIPSVHKNLIVLFTIFKSEREKVDFLKSEYKKYLVDAKKQILVEHFRHRKTFQPILLKLSLLRHEEIYLLPDYFSFKRAMDIPTKSVANYLLEQLSAISENLFDDLKQTMDELREFNINNTAKYMGPISSWHVTSSIKDKTEELMFAVLLDSKKYTG